MKTALPRIVLVAALALHIVSGHSTEVRYCITADAKLRIYIQHWHGSEVPDSSDTMVLRFDNDGTEFTAGPTGHVQDVQDTQTGLPGCESTISDAMSTCNRNENDWVYYDFEAQIGVPVSYTLLAGNSDMLEEGCSELLPVTISGTLRIPTPAPSLSTAPSQEPSLSMEPSHQPSISMTPSLSMEPSHEPTSSMNPSLSVEPSHEPSASPSLQSSTSPSVFPSMKPSLSMAPSHEPSTSTSPSLQPSTSPSVFPSMKPSLSMEPSHEPSTSPSVIPSQSPSITPSSLPSMKPSLSMEPSHGPSTSPSVIPSQRPSNSPSTIPSSLPSALPSNLPSMAPSLRPSMACNEDMEVLMSTLEIEGDDDVCAASVVEREEAVALAINAMPRKACAATALGATEISNLCSSNGRRKLQESRSIVFEVPSTQRVGSTQLIPEMEDQSMFLDMFTEKLGLPSTAATSMVSATTTATTAIPCCDRGMVEWGDFLGRQRCPRDDSCTCPDTNCCVVCTTTLKTPCCATNVYGDFLTRERCHDGHCCEVCMSTFDAPGGRMLRQREP